jgi:pimeloyl-ACP methyl ester carboxylesterase
MDRWQESWAYYSQLIAEKGAFVLNTNYHGSSNHGLKFVESIKGHYYDLEMIDITNGIHLLEKQGKIDMDSLGAMGWSNGAILTTMLTVRYPEMFKVATPGAGDVNWTSDFGTCAFGVSFDQSYFEGAPWDDRDGNFFNMNYIIKSPLFEMEKVKTPTLIFHGSEDRAVPRDQGWEYYRALQQIDKAPVRFLWFPGQPHGPQKITHRLRKMKEELRWFDTYLWKTYTPENEAYKKESPLAEFLQKQKAPQQNGQYGLILKGKLIPEVLPIKEDSTSIGRFEVTNAQYHAFKTSHAFSPVDANLPATGISRDDAISYTKWLSSLTEEAYRLPNKMEAESLQKVSRKAAASENVLNYWAGYELSELDIQDFRKKLDEVQRSLLMNVGSFKGTKIGEAVVYDLGGNAAEYFTGNNGKELYGYSAISYVDDFAEAEKPTAAYIGFRVIKD